MNTDCSVLIIPHMNMYDISHLHISPESEPRHLACFISSESIRDASELLTLLSSTPNPINSTKLLTAGRLLICYTHSFLLFLLTDPAGGTHIKLTNLEVFNIFWKISSFWIGSLDTPLNPEHAKFTPKKNN